MRNAVIQRLIHDSPPIAFFSAACLSCCALLALLAAPQWSMYKERLERVRAYEKYISSSDGFDMVHRKLESKNKQLESKLNGIAEEMPPRTLSGILQEIIGRGKDCGIALSKIQPQSETQPANAEYVPVLLEMKTGYDKLCKYIASLETLPQILQIRKIAVEAMPDGELNVKLLLYCLTAAEGGV